MTLALEPGDRLILLTDGIIEARNRRLELFGFARVSQLAEQNRTAIEIAAAAQDFGQDDDITVLRIERLRDREWAEPQVAAKAHTGLAECNSTVSPHAGTSLA